MIGREKEVKELNRLYNSKKAEFVAIYGRRRVGKTFLVSETLGEKITFRHAGLFLEDSEQDSLNKQLNYFYNSLIEQGMEPCEKPSNWLDAFLLLELYLKKKDDGSRQLVFFDELPWMDTPRSGFITALEAFWNGWGCYRKNLMLVVCGSAISWMRNKLINGHGGLYNRVTYEIKLRPFNLKECEEYYNEYNIPFSRYDIVQSYMIFGGIPFYLGYIDSEYSLAQNVDNLFFKKEAKLKDEYNRLFNSIFTSPEAVKKIVELLYTKHTGYTRKEIVEKAGIGDGGHLTENLNALISSDFVIKYVPFGLGTRDARFKLTDPFCLFYLHFVKDAVRVNERFWQQNSSSQSVSSWRGYAFENVCFNHIDQIKKALDIYGVISDNSAWYKKEDDKVSQIDMIIYRKDNVVNMCEMKFYSDEFTVDKDYYRIIQKRNTILREYIPKKASIQNTLITTYGINRNEYSSIFNNVVVLDDLFN